VAIVSDVEIRLRADVARLQQDMDAARRSVGGALDKISSQAKIAAGALGALGVGLGATAFASFIKKAIDAADVVQDISDRTGVAVQDIAGLQLAFKKGGLEAADMEGAMVKLSRSIGEDAEVFKRLGIATKDSNGQLRSNKDVLYDLADVFPGIENATLKTTLAIDAFGKSGAALVPVLNMGRDGLREMDEMAAKLGLTFDQKLVDAAGEFNDTLDFIGSAGQGVARNIAAELLPTLQSLAGSFLELITRGDTIKKTAQGIGSVFKVLYSVGVGVAEIFSTVGKTIGAAAAQLVAVFQGDFKQAAAIGREWSQDLGSSWTASAKAISDAWNGTGGEVVAALVKTQHASTAVADKVDKDAQKQAEAYKELIETIKMRINESSREAAGLKAPNDAEKLALDLTRDLAAGKLKLTAAQEARARSLIEEYNANLRAADAIKKAKEGAEAYAKVEKELADSRADAIKKANDEAAENEKLAETFGMTKAQIEALELARLEEQLAQRASVGLTLDEIEHLEKLIEAKRRSADAAQKVTDLEETKRFWESIDKTAHDTFVSIADGGKNAAQRLKETFKNVFFDWLYQQTLKKWIINLQGDASFTGLAGGVSSAVGAITGGNGLAGAISNIGSLLGNGLNQLGASITSGIGALGDAIGGGLGSLLNSSALGIGNFAIQAIPIAGAAALAATVFQKAFGMGPKKVTGQGITGMFGADGFTGGQSYQTWTQKGGWFRSDKSGTDRAALDATLAATLNDSYNAIKTATTAYATALGLPTDTITGYAKALNLALSGDAAKDQKAIQDMLVSIGDELANGLVPNLAALAARGESASATLQRVTGNYVALNAILEAMGTTFGAVGVGSLAARERLIELAGGLESLASQAQYFADNYLTEAEKLAPAQKQLTEGLAALGFSSVRTHEEFKAALLSIDKVADPERFAKMLALVQVFDQVTKAAEEAARAQVDALRDAAGKAFDVLSASVDAQKGKLQKSFDTLMAGLDARIAASNDKLAGLRNLASILGAARQGNGAGLSAEVSRQQAQAQIAAALAIARASGVLPDPKTLQTALQAVSQDATNQFSSLADFQRDQLRTANQIEELGSLTDAQLTTEEKALQALLDQKSLAQAAMAAELARLDAIVSSAQAQLNAVNGVASATQEMGDAFRSFAAAIRAALSNQALGGQASVTPANQIEALYNSILGRGSDAAGLQFYLDQLAAGVSLDQIRNEFLNSPEYLAQQSVYNAQQSATMETNAAMLAELQTLNQRMETMEANTISTANSSRQLADQFDAVSAGGGALLTTGA
jgi:hypothetical protein